MRFCQTPPTPPGAPWPSSPLARSWWRRAGTAEGLRRCCRPHLPPLRFCCGRPLCFHPTGPWPMHPPQLLRPRRRCRRRRRRRRSCRRKWRRRTSLGFCSCSAWRSLPKRSSGPTPPTLQRPRAPRLRRWTPRRNPPSSRRPPLKRSEVATPATNRHTAPPFERFPFSAAFPACTRASAHMGGFV